MIALCPVCTTKCKKRSRKKLSGCFFNGVLTTIDGTFLVILLMAYINIEKQSAGLVEQNLSFWLSVLTVLILACELILTPVFLYKKRDDLDAKSTLNRCGYIYS